MVDPVLYSNRSKICKKKKTAHFNTKLGNGRLNIEISFKIQPQLDILLYSKHRT